VTNILLPEDEMPYTRFDAEAYDEFAQELGDESNDGELGERPSGDWKYQPAKGVFKADKCLPVARIMFDLLKAQQAVALKVRYDGGYDEGFSYPEAVLYGDRMEAVEAFSNRLASSEISKLVREATKQRSMWGNAAEFYGKATDDKVIMYALDELANDMATELLGQSYGTGEYQLYGEFTTDLNSGEITDFPGAQKPDSVD
jgi:hypothetical protein